MRKTIPQKSKRRRLIFMPTLLLLLLFPTVQADELFTYVPPLSEIVGQIKTGGSLSELVVLWNPSVLDQLLYETSVSYAGQDLTDWLNQLSKVTTLFFKYIFREPASLVPTNPQLNIL
jgi:hypothetical protein